MWYLIMIVISLLVFIVGLIMVNVRGNYESIWGVFLFGGAASFIVLILGWASSGFFHMFL